jgi:hypothetical protein
VTSRPIRHARSEVLVSREEEFFGLIDYHALKAANAVIDTKKKTIRVAE